ncbi:hypothetical protein SDRG_16810 [Saprolegnia diclina VS20]|uniref:Uncharacterized protein n=1 Tax=Saprolegnia diclina (strain VS20) TaxID=1156394 RepID=T0PIW3_SAPDV|nr:hypothetical protein SDRG_16810 [Saprolegnia diclina VS20]EQC25314.1 hypothetical protein SDRG_16810 [Saprolegnia diclina VS20]|eukprot:XP_008621252.1 hypothetical protein SDRG_16810 [Saprolegnia diclina VS20]
MHPDLEAHLVELKTRQRNMVARRIALEKKQQMRDATMAEFSAAYTDMLKRKQRQIQQHQVIAKKRNHEFLDSLREYQRSVAESRPTPGAIALEKAKVAFVDKVTEVYPAWQEELQRLKMQRLRQLEQEKHEIEYRRLVAQQSFEKEQGLEALLRQTVHEINLATSVERNETYERQLYRQQKLKEAMDLEQAIRERAEDERRRMEDDHFRTLLSPQADYEHLATKYTAAKAPLPVLPEPDLFASIRPPAPLEVPPPSLASSPVLSDPVAARPTLVEPSAALLPPLQHHIAIAASRPEEAAPLVERPSLVVDEPAQSDTDDPILNDFYRMTPAVASPSEPAPAQVLANSEMLATKPPSPAPAVPAMALVAPVVTAHQPTQVPEAPTVSIPVDPPAWTPSIVVAAVPEPTETVVASLPQEAPTMPVPLTITMPLANEDEVPRPRTASPASVTPPSLPATETPDATLATVLCAVDQIKKPKTPSPQHSPQSRLSVFSDAGLESVDLGDAPVVTSHRQSSPTLRAFSPVIDVLSLPVPDVVETLPALEPTAVVPNAEALPPALPSTEQAPSPVPTPETPTAANDAVEDATTPPKPSEGLEAAPVVVPTVTDEHPSEPSPVHETSAKAKQRSPLHLELDDEASMDDPPIESPVPARTSAFPAAESPVPARTSAFPAADSPEPVPASGFRSADDGSVDEFEFEAPSPSKQMGTATAKLSDAERLSLLTQLLDRLETSARSGETHFTSSPDAIGLQSKLDLVKMATTGRKISIFGADVCYALLLEALQDIGPYLFTEDLMVGKMTLQRLTKAYQPNRNKEKDYWRLFNAVLSLLVTEHVLPPLDAAQVFSTAFLTQLQKDDRTARKLRELLLSLCPEPQAKTTDAKSDTKPNEVPSTEPAAMDAPPKSTPAAAPVVGAPAVLGLAFMRQSSQTSSGREPVFGRAKASPIKGASLGQRVLRGASLRDYSDFEVDDDEMEIGSMAPTLASRSSGPKPVLGKQPSARLSVSKPAASQDDDFDENF